MQESGHGALTVVLVIYSLLVMFSFPDLWLGTLIIGFIPGLIGKSKGYDFFNWYVYGVLLFIIALIHSLCLSSKKHNYHSLNQMQESPLEEIRKMGLLRDEGYITEEEFQEKKKKVLNRIK